MIYGLRAGNSMKIGFTACEASFEKRMSSLQTGNPIALEKVFLVPGRRHHEKAAHEILAEQQLTGEWFHVNKHVSAFVNLVRETGSIEIALSDFRRSRGRGEKSPPGARLTRREKSRLLQALRDDGIYAAYSVALQMDRVRRSLAMQKLKETVGYEEIDLG